MRVIFTVLNRPALRNGSSAENLSRRLAAGHVDDEHAARPRRAVLGERPAGEHDDVLVALEVSEMRLRVASRIRPASPSDRSSLTMM